MHRVPAFLAATLLVASVFPSVAGAHPVERYSDDHVYLYCEGFGDELGTALFYADASSTYDPFAQLVYWEAPASPDFDPPTLLSQEAEVSLEGDTFTATLGMYAYSEDPEPPSFVGTATVTAVLEPIGDPESFTYQSEGSNAKYRVDGTTQEFSVSGEASLPGDRVLALDNCFAGREMVSVFATNPDAYVQRSSYLNISCAWELDGGFAYLSGWAEGGGMGADLFVGTEDGAVYGNTEAVTFTKSAFAADFDLFDAGGPEPEPETIGVAAVPGPGDLVGSASASASLTSTGERTRTTDRYGWEKYTVVSQLLAAAGSVEITYPGGELSLAIDDIACDAVSARYQYRSATPDEHAKGPGGGKPLKNDLPENAIPLAVPSSVSVGSTAGTALDPEVPCTGLDPEFGEFPYPIGHTAWWTFEGNGGDVTADTAGSSFDTIVGAYVMDAGEYVQLGCVDDVMIDPEYWSLQAAITIPTDAGVTYYLQVGGYGGETGQLELALY